MTDERWLPVVDFEGRYEVSDLGRVRSLSRYFPHPRNPVKQMRTPERVLTVRAAHNDGYAVVSLCQPRQPCRFRRVHLLVATAFLGPRPPGKECRHLNGDRMDARLVNLAWGTHAENMADMLEHGRNSRAVRLTCPYGHLLKQPNLVAHKLRKGRRNCLACARARASVHNAAARSGATIDFEITAQSFYDCLMGGHADPPPPGPLL